VLFNFAENPNCWDRCISVDRSSMDRHGGKTRRERRVENAEKIVAALRGVIDPAPHLDADRDMLGHRLAHATDDLQGHLRLAEMVSAATAADRRPDRAAEVDVDHVEAGRAEFPRCRTELQRVGSHELSADGMFLADDS
jgi:hypothetical protein